MDYIITLLSDIMQHDKYARMVFLGLAALSAIALVFSFYTIISGFTDPVRRNLSSISKGDKPKSGEQFNDTLESLDKFVSPKDVKERENISTMLMHAGYHHKQAIATFYAIKTLLVILGVGVGLMITYQMPELSSRQVFFVIIVCVFIALFFPNYVLRYQAKKRINRMRATFPDSLDLLVVTTEAGLGFNAALTRVSDETSAMCPELGEELQLIVQKTRVGMPLGEAMQQMIVRTGLFELKGLVGVINQSVRLGSSLADTLREYSEDLRDKRMQAAEEQAAKIGLKMMFPLIFFIWPGFFVVAVGPAALTLIEVFGKIGSGS